jgi:hypothetical protein
MHADLKARDSLVCDLMKRFPHVDADILDLLVNKAFRKTDFFETREGVCRIMPPITTDLNSNQSALVSETWYRRRTRGYDSNGTDAHPTNWVKAKRWSYQIHDRYRSVSA